jgi:signal transduction histidine kinase/CheY-like chemotaxis protein
MFRLEGAHSASIWVELNSILIKLNGEAATLNFIRDVTLQKKLEEQFYQSQKMESIGTLAGGIAHDFNNLLMGIQGNVSVMNLETEGGGPLQESLQSIERCVQSGSQLTNQLLAFARGGKYIVKPCNLNSIVNKASEIFGRTKREVNIHRVFARDVWSVEVDSGQIEQVLMNLFVNAWQAMPDGGDLFIEVENIELDEHYTRIKPFNIRSGRYVKLSVTDTGVGMDAETRKRIFEPFFSTKEKGMGTGLGLASAYGIIKNHGGFINCYSEIGHGTTFNIYFPESDKAIVDEERRRDDELITGVPGGSETILFVDDEEEILAVGRKILAGLGYRVISAPDGKTSLEIYTDRGDQIDLVVLDYVMPGMGGREVFETLRQIDPDVRVLLSSGYSSNNQVAHMLKNGCKGFIQKPYDAVRMARKIREILDA